MKRLVFVSICWVLSSGLAACSDSGSSSNGSGGAAGGGSAGTAGTAGNSTGGVAGSAGSAGSGGTSGSAGSAGSGGTAGSPNPSDYELLRECAEPFDLEAEVQLIENDPTHGANFDQFLTALRDRVPGSYRLARNSSHAQGTESYSDVLVIRADGSVTHASSYNVALDEPHPGNGMWTTPAQSCQLQAASYFQACLDALAGEPWNVECGRVSDPTANPPLDVFTGCEATEVPAEC